jgi:hypothetical protein
VRGCLARPDFADSATAEVAKAAPELARLIEKYKVKA